MKRRDFLKQSTLTSGAFLLPALLKSAQPLAVSGNEFKKLVIVHLQGGNDVLNTVVPYTNETYYRKRPNLAIKSNQLIQLNDSFAFNPALKALMEAYEKGQVLVLNRVGYPDVHSSHYSASRLWQTGWSNTVLPDKNEGYSSFEQNIINNASPLLKEESLGVCDLYNFENALMHISSLINAGGATPVYRLALNGFDTHQSQRLQHDRLLAAYADGMKAFINKLSLSGQLDRTLIMTYSEFGRATAENATHGTEHGAANSIFLIGNKLKHTGMDDAPLDLEPAVVNHKTDFRSVYATIKEKWFESAAIGCAYPGMDFL